jgi:exodeoxyribonuclease VII small subunit
MPENSESFNYQEALNKIENIVTGLENEEISIDQLGEQVQQAMLLISQCKQKLQHTEQQIDGLFNDQKDE